MSELKDSVQIKTGFVPSLSFSLPSSLSHLRAQYHVQKTNTYLCKENN
jgi:hypothetical protein